jgi:hypothetical protein
MPTMTKLVPHTLAARLVRMSAIAADRPRWNESVEAARSMRSAKAAKAAKMVRPIIEGLRASGTTTLSGLAHALNERGVQTSQGRRRHPTTVKRTI